jgi:multidrug efflux pump subunit AcrA (membrane-fusion protein)
LINEIATHQIAHMRVNACPYGEFGTLKGQVSAISLRERYANATQPAILTQLSQPTLYAVTIQPQTLVLQQAAKSCPVSVGMQGKVDIVLREESIVRWLRLP